jgi:hypothetical protein
VLVHIKDVQIFFILVIVHEAERASMADRQSRDTQEEENYRKAPVQLSITRIHLGMFFFARLLKTLLNYNYATATMIHTLDSFYIRANCRRLEE